MSDRLTREEIKRDEVMEGISRVALFVQNHGRTVLYGVATVLVVIAAWAVWDAVATGREHKANEALALAVAQGEEDPGAATEALTAVLDEFGSTMAGSVAHAYLGTAAAEAEDLAAARSHWQDFLTIHRDHALAAGVERNLISLDRAEGQSEALAERLETALTTGESALSEDSVLYELGRTLEDLGRTEGALEIYARLVEEHPGSLYAGQARERTSALEAS